MYGIDLFTLGHEFGILGIKAGTCNIRLDGPEYRQANEQDENAKIRPENLATFVHIHHLSRLVDFTADVFADLRKLRGGNRAPAYPANLAG